MKEGSREAGGIAELKLVVEKMREEDWEQVRAIYLEGIMSENATFEMAVPSKEDWMDIHIPGCSLVARSGEMVLGWVALSQVSIREVYSGVAEVSIYVGERFHGKGIGRALLHALTAVSEDHGFWTLQAGILEENEASLNLHIKCGFREIGRREKIAQMNGVWRNYILLERRSTKIGI
jgi:L-amino acid N-acyltransferase YncA